VLDADKEGYLRSETALIQTIGRAARHLSGTAILYADVMTAAVQKAVEETNRRRAKQRAYNAAHGITPQTIIKSIDDVFGSIFERDYPTIPTTLPAEEEMSLAEIARQVKRLEKQMFEAAAALRFEDAAELRDRIRALREREVRAEVG